MAVDFFRLVNSKGPACCQYLMKSGPGLGPHKVTKAWHGFIQTVLSSTKNIELVTVYMWTSSQGILLLALAWHGFIQNERFCLRLELQPKIVKKSMSLRALKKIFRNPHTTDIHKAWNDRTCNKWCHGIVCQVHAKMPQRRQIFQLIMKDAREPCARECNSVLKLWKYSSFEKWSDWS